MYQNHLEGFFKHKLLYSTLKFPFSRLGWSPRICIITYSQVCKCCWSLWEPLLYKMMIVGWRSVFLKVRDKLNHQIPSLFPVKLHPHLHTKSQKHLHGSYPRKNKCLLWPPCLSTEFRFFNCENEETRDPRDPGQPEWKLREHVISFKVIQELKIREPRD